MPKARVRGIYATALTKILLDRGFSIVQATDTIMNRFNILHSTEPPDVTVKDDEAVLGGIFLMGRCSAVNEAMKAIVDEVGEMALVKYPTPLYSVVLGIVSEEGYVEVAPGVKAILEGGNYFKPGDKVPVTIVNITGMLRAVPYIMPSTDYVRIIESPTVRISRHIRDPDVKMMLTRVGLSKLPQLNGLGIKWRSNAQYLSEDEAYAAVDEALRLLEEVRAKVPSAGDYEVLYEGECALTLIPDAYNRRAFDNVRARVVPTLPGHHALKATMSNTELLDYTEYLLGRLGNGEALARALVDYALQNMATVNIHHIKPSGEVINIGPGDKVSYSDGILVVRRELKPGGTLDGLNIPKEYGDVAYTVAKLGEGYLTHIYVSSKGAFKGAYINVNTPIEATWDGLMYIDLEVDVVVDPEFNVRVIDEDKLSGINPPRLANMAVEAVNMLKGKAVEVVKGYIDMLRRLSVSPLPQVS